jgi:FtsX-like permease family
LARGLAIGVAAAVIAVIIAASISPVFPTGSVRQIEPNPGVQLDWLALSIGAVLVLLFVVGVTAGAAWRASVLATRPSISGERRSRVGNTLASAGVSPTVVTGVRMALEPGRGRTSVPVRSTILGTTFALVALVAAITFSGSINRLVKSPPLYGWNWDAMVGPPGNNDQQSRAKATRLLQTDRSVDAFANGTIADIEIGPGKDPTFVIAFDPVQGDVGPSLIEGKVPVASDEIALGTSTLRAAHASVGDRLDVSLHGSPPRSLRVVGRVSLPTLFFTSNLPGQGGVMSFAGLRAYFPEVGPDVFFVRFKPTVAPRLEFQHLTDNGFFVVPRRDPQDLNDMRRVAKLPVVLAGLLALLSAATLVHTLVTSIRRRRRDLAILKTIGFVRGQVGSTVAWQASTLVAVSLLIGIPVGIAAGRWLWRLFTDQLGVVPSPVIPPLELAIIAAGALALANLAAFLPGRVASRMRPAVVLRTE